MRCRGLRLDERGARRVGKDAGEPAPIARVRISGGRITCASCGRLSVEVVLLDPARPLCSACVGESPSEAGAAPDIAEL